VNPNGYNPSILCGLKYGGTYEKRVSPDYQSWPFAGALHQADEMERYMKEPANRFRGPQLASAGNLTIGNKNSFDFEALVKKVGYASARIYSAAQEHSYAPSLRLLRCLHAQAYLRGKPVGHKH